jgi:hypothetical protein
VRWAATQRLITRRSRWSGLPTARQPWSRSRSNRPPAWRLCCLSPHCLCPPPLPPRRRRCRRQVSPSAQRCLATWGLRSCTGRCSTDGLTLTMAGSAAHLAQSPASARAACCCTWCPAPCRLRRPSRHSGCAARWQTQSKSLLNTLACGDCLLLCLASAFQTITISICAILKNIVHY